MAAEPGHPGPADPPAVEQAAPRKAESAPPRQQDQAVPQKAEPKPAERGTEQIRREISDQRNELTRSLSDLREGVHSARRIPLIVGGALVAGVAAVLTVKAVRGDDD